MIERASQPDVDFRSWVPTATIPGTSYEILEEPIGEGGYGRIYKVRHVETGRLCALKALNRDLVHRRDVTHRLKQEVRAIAQLLPHPNLVDVYDAGHTLDNRYYYVMELLEGQNLRQHLNKYAGLGLPPEQACWVMQQVLSALSKAHAHGIVHRDIKPDNVFLARDAAKRSIVVKLLDFGIAKVFGEASVQTAPGAPVGTLHYFAPETLRGDPPSPLTDIYAVGVTLWEALTGENPFVRATELATLAAIVNQGVPPLEALPVAAKRFSPALCDVVRRATHLQPALRYPSAEAFIEALAHATQPALPAPSALRLAPSVSTQPLPRANASRIDSTAPTKPSPVPGHALLSATTAADAHGFVTVVCEPPVHDMTRGGTLRLPSVTPPQLPAVAPALAPSRALFDDIARATFRPARAPQPAAREASDQAFRDAPTHTAAPHDAAHPVVSPQVLPVEASGEAERGVAITTPLHKPRYPRLAVAAAVAGGVGVVGFLGYQTIGVVRDRMTAAESAPQAGLAAAAASAKAPAAPKVISLTEMPPPVRAAANASSVASAQTSATVRSVVVPADAEALARGRQAGEPSASNGATVLADASRKAQEPHAATPASATPASATPASATAATRASGGARPATTPTFRKLPPGF